MATKINSKIVALTVSCLTVINKELNSLIEEFGAIEVLNPADSYLFGVIRAVQASFNYLSSFAIDLDRQANKRELKVDKSKQDE
jgi:hypothetical protein